MTNDIKERFDEHASDCDVFTVIIAYFAFATAVYIGLVVVVEML